MDYFPTFGISVGLSGGRFNTGDPVFLLLFGLLAVLAEGWLACRKRQWPGLLLPAASFLWTLGCFLAVYGSEGNRQFLERMEIGNLALLWLLLWNNLPTLLLLAVYGVCRWLRRRRHRRTRELDKMHIDDL